MQESLVRIGQAMDAARAAGIPIVVVQEDGFGKGTRSWKVHDVVASRASDLHIHKTLPSAFANTGLAGWLAERDINTVSVLGYMTHNCNASTLFDARHLGLNAEFLSDATGAVPYANAAGRATAEEIHRVFSVVFESNFAAVVSTEKWIAAVQAGQSLARDSVMASNARASSTLGLKFMSTALLIIDVQHALCSGEYKAFESERVIERINLVARKMRDAGAPVIVIQHESEAGPLDFGTEGWKLAEGLETLPTDVFVRKATDSFHQTELHALLQERDVKDLVICGMQSEFCVDTTTRRALALGYPVVLVADGHSTLDNTVLTAAQISAHHNETCRKILLM